MFIPETLAPGVELTLLSGFCPVQGEGTVDGQPFFFRARHNTISLAIGGGDLLLHPDWEWCEMDDASRTDADIGEGAGWLDHIGARAYILIFAQYYQQGIPGNGVAYHRAQARQTIRGMLARWPGVWDRLSPERRQEIAELFADEG